MRKKVKKTKGFNWGVFSLLFLICFLFACLAYARERGVLKRDTALGSFVQQRKDSLTESSTHTQKSTPNPKKYYLKIEPLFSGWRKYFRIGCFFYNLFLLIWESSQHPKNFEYFDEKNHHVVIYSFRCFVRKRLFSFGYNRMMRAFAWFLIAFLLEKLFGYGYAPFLFSDFLFFSALPYLLFTAPLLVVYDFILLRLAKANMIPESLNFLVTYYKTLWFCREESVFKRFLYDLYYDLYINFL